MSDTIHSILVVDDLKAQRVATKTTIIAASRDIGERYEVLEAGSVEEARGYFKDPKQLPCLVIVDMHMPRNKEGPDPEYCEYAGYELLREITKRFPDIWWLIVSAQPQLNQVVVEDEGRPLLSAITSYSNVIGIWFKTKEADLQRILEQFLIFESQNRKGKNTNRFKMGGSVRESLANEVFIATSSISLNIYNKVRMLSLGSQPVLIIGERGVGKELVSKLLHKLTKHDDERLQYTYKKVNGGTVNYEELIDLLEKVGKGTLYIENIDLMPKSLQDDLTRNVVELTNFPARVVYGIARHHSTFNSAVISDDIYLTSLVLPLPSLRERLDEIIELVQIFLDSYNSRVKTTKKLVQSDQVDELLRSGEWKNNLDDLRLVVEQAATMTPNPGLGLAEFKDAVQQRKIIVT